MAMTRLSDPMPRMTLSRALLSEALRLARSPLTAVHLVCGLAAGLACGEYFSVTRWDPRSRRSKPSATSSKAASTATNRCR